MSLDTDVQTMCGSTHQALGARVDDEDKEKTNGEPRLRVLHIELTKGYYTSLLRDRYTRDAHGGLDAEQEEVHVEFLAGHNKLVRAVSNPPRRMCSAS